MRILFAALATASLAAPAAAVTVIGAAQAAPASYAPAPVPSLEQLVSPAATRSPLPGGSTWTTMIIGFALVGFAARWRKSSAMPKRQIFG